MPTLDLLDRALGDARMLVVLDNCEHVLEGCAQLVETVLRAGDGVRILVTGQIIQEIKENDYGGRSYGCRDLEGHVWTFGTYDPWSST